MSRSDSGRTQTNIPAPGERLRVARCSVTDAGFTFVELLVALSLLLITLIAVVGLATTSSFMTGSARQRAAMLNAAAGYLERVRQTPYNEIGLPGGDPVGTLAAIETSSAPYVVTITPQVTWGRPEDPGNHDFKTVTLSVTSIRMGGGSLMDYSTAAVYADVGTAGGQVAVASTPTITITSPAEGSVVSGAPVPISASAASNSAASTLVWMELFDGATPWGPVAVSGSTAQHTWSWDTTSAREGRHALTPRVTDSASSVFDGAPVTLLVDNEPPTAPGGPSVTFPDAANGTVYWTAATDGTDVDGTTPLAASHYVVSAYRQPTSASLASDYTRWNVVSGFSGLSVADVPTQATPLAIPGLAGFSRYCAAVWASSPDRGTAPGLTSATPATVVGVTKSTATGTWKTAKSGSGSSLKYTITVKVSVPSGPTFPWTGSATTRIYRLASATQDIASGVLIEQQDASSGSWQSGIATDEYTTAAGELPTARYYAAITSLTPAGFASTLTPVSSCVLGPPADTTSTGTRNLVITRW